jgi:hypothetical protein
MLTADELRRFVHYNYPDVAVSLPGSAGSYQEYASAVVKELHQRGMIDRGFFDRLVLERPGYRDYIDDVAANWGHVLRQTKGQTTFSVPSDLHDALIRLTASQREQVMYLAGFAGGDVSTRVMRGIRERPPISAREIFERARAGGPEGLERLAEAIDIVTATK